MNQRLEEAMKPPYTSRQGQFLTYIHSYMTVHKCAPSEAEMVEFFQVTPPTVHSMILTLERRKLISRVPGQARSITLRLSPQDLPPSPGPISTAHPPTAETTEREASLLRVGKNQLEDLFVYDEKILMDDSEFIPLLDLLINSFARAGAGESVVQLLRFHACNLYHQLCERVQPGSTFQKNMGLMWSYLPASRRVVWKKSKT